jgi:hypothetical protein
MVITSGFKFGGGSNFGRPPDIAGPPPDLAGSAILYFFLKIRSHALIGHFGGATWCPLIGPCGTQLLAPLLSSHLPCRHDVIALVGPVVWCHVVLLEEATCLYGLHSHLPHVYGCHRHPAMSLYGLP